MESEASAEDHVSMVSEGSKYATAAAAAAAAAAAEDSSSPETSFAESAPSWPSNLCIGDEVEARDGSGEWEPGKVAYFNEDGVPMVIKDGYSSAFAWDEVSAI